MKKKIILSIILLMTFWGYSQNDPIMADFGLINNTLITFELTSEKDFVSHKNYSFVYNVDKEIQKRDSLYVLNLENKTIILQDKFDEEDPAFTKYTYQFSVANFLCFEVRYYEITTNLIINQESGSITELLGEIIFSPDCKFIFVASKTINYDPFQNTIEVYKIANNQIKLITEYNIGNWIPDSIKWINNKTVLFVQKFNSNNTNYLKMTISEN
ncbi:MAG TPA: beta-propeller fold lactonase family protein [Bacteroidales bacterium]|jgi:hypothetical protein|nr:beta-propeller fold lactonase family protein [Bacteroidales bacterium]